MSSRYKHPNLWQGCVGAWAPSQQPLGGLTLFDQTNRKQNGTLTGMDPATDWVADDGGALDFDGVNDEVVTGLNGIDVRGNWSLSVWVNWPSIVDDQVCFGCRNAGGDRFYMGIDGTDVFMGAGDTFIHTDDNIPHGMVANAWYHLAMTVDGSTAVYYVDGSKITSFSYSGTSAIANALALGNIGGTTGFFGHCSLDDSIVWSRTLSSQDIYQLASQRGAAYEKKRRVISSIPSEAKAPPAVRRNASRWRHPNLWDGCVGAWSPPHISPGGDIARDYSTRKNHGTLTNMDPATDWVMDEGYALDFDGADDNVDCGNSIQTTSAMTVALWIKPSTVSSYTTAMAKSDGSNGGWTVQLRGADDEWRFWINFGSNTLGNGSNNGWYYAKYPKSWQDNDWHHLIGIWDGANKVVKIYIDSQAGSFNSGASPASESSSFSDYDGSLKLGGESDNANLFSGNLSDVRIYDRALTSHEVRQLYNGGQRGAAYQRGSKLLAAPTAVATASTVPYYYNSLLTGSGV